jgi:anti-sigma-K factor RskA
MSQGPELSDLEALAAEHALGVLSGPERAAAEARAAGDPAFAALVESWRERLAPLLDAVAPAAPPAALWRRIERAVPANDEPALHRRLRFWQGAAIGSAGLAAASLAAAVMLAVRLPVAPQVTAAPAAPILNASLMSPEDGGRPMFVAAYDPARHALIVTSLMKPGADPEHVHELWVIPADGKPHPIGMIAPGSSKAMRMPMEMAPMFTPGAAIAVSVEPPGGSPMKTAPSGPIAAMGHLARI